MKNCQKKKATYEKQYIFSLRKTIYFHHFVSTYNNCISVKKNLIIANYY